MIGYVEAVLRGGPDGGGVVIEIPDAFRRKISRPVARLVLLALAEHANEAGEAWPAVGTLADELDLDPGTVRIALRVLEAVELVDVVERSAGGRGNPSRYRLTTPPPTRGLAPEFPYPQPAGSPPSNEIHNPRARPRVAEPETRGHAPQTRGHAPETRGLARDDPSEPSEPSSSTRDATDLDPTRGPNPTTTTELEDGGIAHELRRRELVDAIASLDLLRGSELAQRRGTPILAPDRYLEACRRDRLDDPTLAELVVDHPEAELDELIARALAIPVPETPEQTRARHEAERAALHEADDVDALAALNPSVDRERVLATLSTARQNLAQRKATP